MAPNSIMSYGKVSRQASLDTRNKTRRRLSIIAVSAVLLVAVVVVATVLGTHRPGSSSDPHPHLAGPDHQTSTATLSTSIKAVCDATLYPGSCFATLSPMLIKNNNSMISSIAGLRLDSMNLFHISLQVAKDALTKASSSFHALHSVVGLAPAADNMTLAAFSSCKELVALAADHLDDCRITSSDLLSGEAFEDLKTWLSAAITYQHTCIDGFPDELRGSVAHSLRNSTEFASNSLAILSQFASLAGHVKLPRRRHLIMASRPSWLSSSSSHRRFLQQGSGPMKTAVDIVVAKDGSGKFKTIQAALSAVPTESSKRTVIYVKKGVYDENVRVEKDKWNVVMIGDGMYATVVSGWLNFVDGTPTFKTATFAVFGKNFMARDMGFKNTAGAAKQQAVAVVSDSDRSVFYRCSFDAFQDTLYAHTLRQFYRDCDIYGTVDFIFGNAAAVFQGCNILPRVPMSGQQDTITAQGKVDPNQNTGISIVGCTVKPSGDLASVKVYLGRPWKDYSTTVFMKTAMAGIIDPAGWLAWTGDSAPPPDTIFYSEYENSGPGSATANRVKWKGLRTMDSDQAAKFTVGKFIEGDSWVPNTAVPFQSGL